jgi:hypothetical protein
MTTNQPKMELLQVSMTLTTWPILEKSTMVSEIFQLEFKSLNLVEDFTHQRVQNFSIKKAVDFISWTIQAITTTGLNRHPQICTLMLLLLKSPDQAAFQASFHDYKRMDRLKLMSHFMVEDLISWTRMVSNITLTIIRFLFAIQNR